MGLIWVGLDPQRTVKSGLRHKISMNDRKLKKKEKIARRGDISFIKDVWADELNVLYNRRYDFSGEKYKSKHTKRAIRKGYKQIFPHRATRNEGDVVRIGWKAG